MEIKPFANMVAIRPTTRIAAITSVRTATVLFDLFIMNRFMVLYVAKPGRVTAMA